jgi:hypothetical protein
MQAHAGSCQHKGAGIDAGKAPERVRKVGRQRGWPSGRLAGQGRARPEVAKQADGGGVLERVSSTGKGKASSRDGTCHHCNLATWTRAHPADLAAGGRARLSSLY